jgi:hypothetical protein
VVKGEDKSMGKIFHSHGFAKKGKYKIPKFSKRSENPHIERIHVPRVKF